MTLTKISSKQLKAAKKAVDSLNLDGGEAADLKGFFEELAAGELEGALQTYSWAFDTITRETALDILDAI